MKAPSTNTLHPVPQPPHDPTWWLLNARAGWRAALLEDAESAPGTGALRLRPLPGAELPVADGTLGGLVLPANVALGPDGSVFLLDPAQGLLKRFDPCACRFETVPHFGGPGEGPRNLREAGGIAIGGGNLYVADTGNGRVSVFALRGFVLRAHWRPPASAGLPGPWEPSALTFDGRGRLWVTDRANGILHRFHPSGQWQGAFGGFGRAAHLAVDCSDRIYVTEEGDERVRVVDPDGREIARVARAAELAGRFPPLPFPLAGPETLDLGGLCAAPEGGSFDLHGDPTSNPVGRSGAVYPRSGVYVSQALDSRIYGCQWHRVALSGQLPAGTRVRVLTYTAEVDQPIEHVLALPLEAWETRQTAHSLGDEEWDCLVRSGPGRYLWLRLELSGNGAVSPTLTSVRVEYPRVSLRRYLPAVFGADPHSADFTDRFLSIFDTTFRSIEAQLDDQAALFDPDAAPAERGPAGPDFLSWLGSWIGVTLDRQWPEQKRRRLLKEAGRLYPLRGTREGLYRQLLLLLDLEPQRRCCPGDAPRRRCAPPVSNCAPRVERPCAWTAPPLILEHYQLRRWLLLGQGRLGDQAVLWGSRIVNRSQVGHSAQTDRSQLVSLPDPHRDPFHVYAHRVTVFVPASFGRVDGRRRALENLLAMEVPAHVRAQVEYVEPRFRIGVQSMIGLDSVVGRYPEGHTLGETALGRDSVLGPPPHEAGGPSLEVGSASRVGSTTRLE